MINPQNITNYDRTTAELEEFLLFSIAVVAMRSEGYTSGKTPYNCKWCGLVHIGHPNKGNQ